MFITSLFRAPSPVSTVVPAVLTGGIGVPRRRADRQRRTEP